MLKHLILSRPLVSIDLETTGLVEDAGRVVEVGIVKVWPDQSVQCWSRRVHPGIAIPAAATAVHGISDRDVAGCPTLDLVLFELVEVLAGADITGFNLIGFDLPILAAETRRLGWTLPLTAPGSRCVDAMLLYHDTITPGRGRGSLRSAAAHYGVPVTPRHGALLDALAGLLVLDAHVGRYHGLPRMFGELVELFAVRWSLLHSDPRAVLAVSEPPPEPVTITMTVQNRVVPDPAPPDPGNHAL